MRCNSSDRSPKEIGIFTVNYVLPSDGTSHVSSLPLTKHNQQEYEAMLGGVARGGAVRCEVARAVRVHYFCVPMARPCRGHGAT